MKVAGYKWIEDRCKDIENYSNNSKKNGYSIVKSRTKNKQGRYDTDKVIMVHVLQSTVAFAGD